jgi:hypothetical protein
MYSNGTDWLFGDAQAWMNLYDVCVLKWMTFKDKSVNEIKYAFWQSDFVSNISLWLQSWNINLRKIKYQADFYQAVKGSILYKNNNS